MHQPASDQEVSIAPNGEAFALPHAKNYADEFKRLQSLARRHREDGREIVVVMGVGFVGAVMAGVVADASLDDSDRSPYFVIGMQRPSTRS